MTDRPPAPWPRAGTPQVLLVDADADLAGLIEQWLQPERLCLRRAPAGRPDPAANAAGAAGGGDTADAAAVDLVIAELPYPSRVAVAALRAQLGAHGRAPLLVLSATVFASVDCCGPAAQALGADALLPKPTTGGALRLAVRRLLSG